MIFQKTGGEETFVQAKCKKTLRVAHRSAHEMQNESSFLSLAKVKCQDSNLSQAGVMVESSSHTEPKHKFFQRQSHREGKKFKTGEKLTKQTQLSLWLLFPVAPISLSSAWFVWSCEGTVHACLQSNRNCSQWGWLSLFLQKNEGRNLTFAATPQEGWQPKNLVHLEVERERERNKKGEWCGH